MSDPRVVGAKASHTQDQLNALLRYDEVTGKLFWKVNSGRAVVGKEAGCKHNKGYVAVAVEGTTYLAHRVIWCMIYGSFPVSLIDHKDDDGTNNRLCNLRLADGSKNNANQGIRADNTSGVKGVSLHYTGKWLARVQYQGKRLLVGMFDTLEDAAKAIKVKREKLHKEFANHG